MLKCPNCGFDSPPDMKFCGMCGTELHRTCPECGFANPLDYLYCGQCGNRLATSPGTSRPLLAEQSGDAPVLDLLGEKAEETAKPLAGQRRQVTVILADVVGSTNLLEKLGTEAWVELMNQALQVLEAEVYRYGGSVDQFRGDGLVAFFGARAVHEDDPERAVLSALAMQDAIRSFISKRDDGNGIELKLRVGVNTGEVVVANIGDSSTYSEDTAMGEAVALAARMEGAAEPGTVLVSENTYLHVTTEFEWLPLGKIVVEGVSRPVAIYRPISPEAEPAETTPLQQLGLIAPIIGREEEKAVLEGRLDDLCDGRGSIVLISGEGGMGKSRLLSELRRNFTCPDDSSAREMDNLPVTWLRSRCRSYEQSQPYSAWITLIWNWLGLREGESEEGASSRLRDLSQTLWPEHSSNRYPHLATLLSLPLDEESRAKVKYLDAHSLHHRLYQSVHSWILALASRAPLVVAFSGGHWMDDSSVDLLEYCLPISDEAAVMWQFSYRPERSDAVWEFIQKVERDFPHRVTSLTFGHLSMGESEELLNELIGPGVLPEQTKSLVLEKAEGNPYFIEELVRSLIEEEALVQDIRTGEWHATRAVATLDLPDTLNSLLLSRLDTVSPDERQVLQLAAVIGSIFWSGVLESLTRSGANLKRQLTTLQRVQLIEERGRFPHLGMEYSFKSSLIRDAVYESMLASSRKQYHNQIADCLETLLGHETSGQHYGLLAYHYQAAGKRRKELFYTMLAAEQAKEVYANLAALDAYNRALHLLTEVESETSDPNRLYAIHSQLFEVYDGRREVHIRMANYESARKDAEVLLPLAHQLDDDPAWLIDALLRQPGLSYWTEAVDQPGDVEVAKEALALAEEIGDKRRQMESLVAIADQHLAHSDPEAFVVGERALTLARELGDQRAEAQLLLAVSSVYNWSDRVDEAVTYLEDALAICQSLDDRRTEIDLLHQLGRQYERKGDYYQQLEKFERKRLQLSREINHRLIESEALMSCGQIEGVYLGDHTSGLALVEEARRVWEGTRLELLTTIRRMQILTNSGDIEEALELLEGVDPATLEVHEGIRAGFRIVKAMLLNCVGEPSSFRRALAASRAVAAPSSGEALLSRQYSMAAAVQATVALLGLADSESDAQVAYEYRQQALDNSSAALAVFQQLGYVQIVECVSEELLFHHFRALAATGRHEEAATFLLMAYNEMQRKHDLIPAGTPYRETFLKNVPLHRSISAAYHQGPNDPAAMSPSAGNDGR